MLSNQFKTPTHFTAKTLEWRETNRQLVLKGSVQFEQDIWSLRCDWMEVKLNRAGDILSVHAKGQIQFVVKAYDLVIHTHSLAFYTSKNLLELKSGFYGSWRGQSLRGAQATLWIDEERILIEKVHGVLKLPKIKPPTFMHPQERAVQEKEQVIQEKEQAVQEKEQAVQEKERAVQKKRAL